MQVHDRWAVADRHHMDAAPGRALDETSVGVGSEQHPTEQLFDRGRVPRCRFGGTEGGHGPTIRATVEVA